MSKPLRPDLTRREFTRHSARALALGAMSGSLAAAAQAIATETPPLRVGAATSVITPPLGSWQQGAGVTRKGERIRDELEANALYMTDGRTPLLLISCDLVALELAVVKPIREAISAASGVPPRQVIITCTHTHSSSETEEIHHDASRLSRHCCPINPRIGRYVGFVRAA